MLSPSAIKKIYAGTPVPFMLLRLHTLSAQDSSISTLNHALSNPYSVIYDTFSGSLPMKLRRVDRPGFVLVMEAGSRENGNCDV